MMVCLKQQIQTQDLLWGVKMPITSSGDMDQPGHNAIHMAA